MKRQWAAPAKLRLRFSALDAAYGFAKRYASSRALTRKRGVGNTMSFHRDTFIMSPQWTQDLKHLIWGRLLESAEAESILFHAILCDLRPRFIPKGRIGRGYRAIARNGRVLLTSRLPLEALVGREAVIRLQPWRKIILPGEKPQVYGILLSVRCIDPDKPFRLDRATKDKIFQTRLSD